MQSQSVQLTPQNHFEFKLELFGLRLHHLFDPAKFSENGRDLLTGYLSASGHSDIKDRMLSTALKFGVDIQMGAASELTRAVYLSQSNDKRIKNAQQEKVPMVRLFRSILADIVENGTDSIKLDKDRGCLILSMFRGEDLIDESKLPGTLAESVIGHFIMSQDERILSRHMSFLQQGIVLKKTLDSFSPNNTGDSDKTMQPIKLSVTMGAKSADDMQSVTFEDFTADPLSFISNGNSFHVRINP